LGPPFAYVALSFLSLAFCLRCPHFALPCVQYVKSGQCNARLIMTGLVRLRATYFNTEALIGKGLEQS